MFGEKEIVWDLYFSFCSWESTNKDFQHRKQLKERKTCRVSKMEDS